MCVNLHTAIESEMSIWRERLKTEKHEIVSDDVLYVVSKLSGVPIEKISEKENKELLKLNEYLSSAIIGQDEAINKVSTTIQRNRVGIRKKDRTAGNFIFLGPTGVGKTQLAKEIAMGAANKNPYDMTEEELQARAATIQGGQAVSKSANRVPMPDPEVMSGIYAQRVASRQQLSNGNTSNEMLTAILQKVLKE
jgi:flagellar biosynthesis GTPase FlhF